MDHLSNIVDAQTLAIQTLMIDLYSHNELEGLLMACHQIMALWYQDGLAVTHERFNR
jgi:hypothetical protein